MNVIHAITPLYSLSGFVVGVLIGMTGMGGGSLMTPALILLFGIHPAMAVGTDLLYACITKVAGTLFHGFARRIDWGIVARLACGSVPATALTLLVLSRTDLNSGGVHSVITTVLGCALLATATALIFRKQILKWVGGRVDTLSERQRTVSTIAVGAALGVLVSISSVGAGALGVTALVILYPRLPLAKIVGSDIAHAVPLTLLGGVGHLFLGSVDWPLLGSLVIGSIPGIFVGSFLSGRIPDHVLRLILAAVLILVGVRLLM